MGRDRLYRGSRSWSADRGLRRRIDRLARELHGVRRRRCCFSGSRSRRGSGRAHHPASRAPSRRYLSFFSSRDTALGAISAFFITGGVTGFLLFLGAYLQKELGLTLGQVGMVFLWSGVASLAGAFGAGLSPTARKEEGRTCRMPRSFRCSSSPCPRVEGLAALRGPRAGRDRCGGPARSVAVDRDRARAGRVPRRVRRAPQHRIAVGKRRSGHRRGGALPERIRERVLDGRGRVQSRRVPSAPRRSRSRAEAANRVRKRWKRILLGLFAALFLFVTVGIPYLLAVLITGAGTRPMDLELTSSPADYGLSFEEVTFSRDGRRSHLGVAPLRRHREGRGGLRPWSLSIRAARFSTAPRSFANRGTTPWSSTSAGTGRADGERVTLGYEERKRLRGRGRVSAEARGRRRQWCSTECRWARARQSSPRGRLPQSRRSSPTAPSSTSSTPWSTT